MSVCVHTFDHINGLLCLSTCHLYRIIIVSILCVKRVLGQININWMFLSLRNNHDLGALLNRKFLRCVYMRFCFAAVWRFLFVCVCSFRIIIIIIIITIILPLINSHLHLNFFTVARAFVFATFCSPNFSSSFLCFFVVVA